MIRWFRPTPPLADEYLSLRVQVALLTAERDALQLEVSAANERAAQAGTDRDRPFPYAWKFCGAGNEPVPEVRR